MVIVMYLSCPVLIYRKWHKVSIQREGQTTSLILDSVYQKWTANFDDLKFGRSNTKTRFVRISGSLVLQSA